jgi:ABC-type transport system involved in multi-copper enzyme maturation permease subunit
MGEAVRRRLVWLALAGALAFLTLYATAWHLALSNPRNITNAANRLIESQAESMFELLGLYAANILTVMMAILGSIDALSGAIASGAMQTLAAKPIRRGQILLGKWIGFLVLLSVFQALLVGGVMAIAWVFAGVIPPHAGLGAALLWGEMVLLLTLTLLWGTRLTTLANGVVSIGLFGLAFLGGWVEQIGALTHHPRAVEVGVMASLVMPSEALWRRAAFEMQSPLMSAMQLGPFTSASVPSRAMIVYAALYTAAALALALRSFASRDL